jgi:bis(5'-adenosyl)-triphosphatase
VPRLRDLSAEECAALFAGAHEILRALEPHVGATALNLAVQDGADAGQSVPHVHIHLLPRRPGDFARNDDLYEELENGAKPEVERVARSAAAMAAEAATLRSLFPDHSPAPALDDDPTGSYP